MLVIAFKNQKIFTCHFVDPGAPLSVAYYLNGPLCDVKNLIEFNWAFFQVSIANNLDFKLLAPRKKITIMLIGNHSAGKSSFVNW